ncbi:hypothetical protein L6164_014214 [Bauhinia variegata]|uniref:Uncharacterized protein n=1 Tax=Bauhinia variegata TaxID=167791 RepID=A0ACB9NGU0_BAUVA|nr:hypothetical protein L6164_014214 [Bauhinia variegata]
MSADIGIRGVNPSHHSGSPFPLSSFLFHDIPLRVLLRIPAGNVVFSHRIHCIMIMDFWDHKMLRSLFFVSFLFYTTLAHNNTAVPDKKWPTLSGHKPAVVARGGFTGLMPESSTDGILTALATSVDDVVIMCSLQMTKDRKGICLTDIRLDNSTTVAATDPEGKKTYKVNGKDVTAWFSVDYTTEMLKNVALTQPMFSRLNYFDGVYPITSVEELFNFSSRNWLNVQNAAFFLERGIPVVDYVLNVMKQHHLDIISSPEIAFLKNITRKLKAGTTKVIFQLLNPTDVEPSTGQQYGSIVKDLGPIKSFASGIMVPKDYIWPVRADKYLGERTTLVADAHKQGLEVYASGFANDMFSSYNYSYDPVVEYLQFIDKGDSVDGVITDFPPSASEAVACFAHNNTIVRKVQALVISNAGASSVYPGSSDLAYQQAVDDGADFIDCTVQMSKDGVAFCLTDIDLMAYTTAVSTFMSRNSRVPEIKPGNGIYSFDLTWSEIQTLKPQMVNIFTNFKRNPANKNIGRIITLSEFLDFAKAKAVKGVLIDIQNARYLISKKSLDIVSVVSTALRNATLDKNSTQQVLIQSDDTAVLSKFKDIPSYKRVLFFKKANSDAPKPTVDEIKKYADAVNIPRSDVILVANSLTTAKTNIVKEMKDGNLTVFVHVFRNEMISLAADYFSDPYVELATFIQNYKIDGVVTDTPATASRYLRSPCSDLATHDPTYKIQPAEVASLVSAVKDALPPAKPPAPVLQISDIVDPPLPEMTVAKKTETTAAATPKPTPPPSGAWTNGANVALSLVAILMFAVLSSGY